MRFASACLTVASLLLSLLLAVACNANAFNPQQQPPKQQDDEEDAFAPEVDGPDADVIPEDTGAPADVASPEPDGDAKPAPEDAGTAESVQDVPVAGCTDPEALNYDPGATVDDGSCILPVSVTFNLDTSCASNVVAPQVAGGNTFGMPGDHPMSDPELDDIWTVTIPLSAGFSTYYTYTLDACTDWSCKEKIGGQDCAKGDYDDRFFTMGSQSMVIDACFSVCGDGFCGQCPADAPPAGGSSSCEAGQVKVTFWLDMSKAWDIAKNNVIALQASFDGDPPGFWPGIVMERKRGTKLYFVSVCLAPDTEYTYKFGSYQWTNDANEFPNGQYAVEDNPCGDGTVTAACQFGTCTDRTLETGTEDMVVGVFPWGECNAYDVP
jgi:hypothetical protein